LRQAGRLRRPVVALPGPRPGALALVRGDAQGERVAIVERGNTPLWTLLR
jgi:hypothetical protein